MKKPKTIESVTAKILRYPTRTLFMKSCGPDMKWLRETGNVHILDELRPSLREVKDEITVDYLMDRVRKSASLAKFEANYYKLFCWARDNGHLDKVHAVLPPKARDQINKSISVSKQVFTDQEILAHAKQFNAKSAWAAEGARQRAAGQNSHWGAARKRGTEFMDQCTAHMVDGRGRHQGNQKHTDEDLHVSALPFKHRNDWKKAKPYLYEAARNRGILEECCEHMEAAINPYKDACFIVYAYEFSDGCCYVGLTCRPEKRHAEHGKSGPVYEHIQKTGLEAVGLVVEEGLTALQAIEGEKTWQAEYLKLGRTPLWKAKAGSVGTLHRVSKWTKEAVLEEARRFQTKQAWIDGSQGTYRIAKREGWFGECVAHMPAKDTSSQMGRVTSEATKEKQRARKLGGKLSEEHKAKIGASLRGNKNARRLPA